jgi:hypothetical protein
MWSLQLPDSWAEAYSRFCEVGIGRTFQTPSKGFLSGVPKASQHFSDKGGCNPAPPPARNDEHRLKLRCPFRRPADHAVSGCQQRRPNYASRILRVDGKTRRPPAQIILSAQEKLPQHSAAKPEKLLWRRINVVGITNESLGERPSHPGMSFHLIEHISPGAVVALRSTLIR